MPDYMILPYIIGVATGIGMSILLWICVSILPLRDRKP